MTPGDPITCYKILQVSPHSSDADIKRAFRRLAMIHHPDRHPHNRVVAERRFRIITDAYAQIATAERRAAYDRSLGPAGAPASANTNRAMGWDKTFAGLFRNAPKTEKSRA